MPENVFSQFKVNNFDPLSKGTLTVAECAALSNDVYYQFDDPERPPLPPGWSRHIGSNPNSPDGYFGAVYLKIISPTNVGVVVAHRGTVLSEFGNVLGDLEMACKKAPIQHIAAMLFWDKVAAPELKKHFEGRNINIDFLVHTGHSLGGVLSDMCCFGTNPSITFENPGSKNAWIDFYRSFITSSGEVPPSQVEKVIQHSLSEMAKQCRTYLADANLINTCNEQIGQAFSVLPLTYNYYYGDGAPGTAIHPIPKKNMYYVMHYTFDQHRMAILSYKLNTGAEIKPVSYPFGVQNGYRYYLDYEARRDYWFNYATEVWGLNPNNLQEQYEGKFDRFFSDFVTNLKRLREESLTQSIGPQTEDYDSQKENSFANQHGLFSKTVDKSDLDEEDFVMIEKNENDSATADYTPAKKGGMCSIQ